MAGIPEYRLPREVVRKEIELIALPGGGDQDRGALWVRDVTLESCGRQGYEAFFLGIGARLGYKLKIEGEARLSPGLRRHHLPQEGEPASLRHDLERTGSPHLPGLRWSAAAGPATWDTSVLTATR